MSDGATARSTPASTIATRSKIASCDDVAQYVAHRLALAGTDHSLFAQDAIALIHENATGALRDIDRLAHGAMRDAARRKHKTVDRDAVERVLAGRIPIN